MGITSIDPCLVSNLYPTDTRLASFSCFESPDRQLFPRCTLGQSTAATSGPRVLVAVLLLLLVHWTLIPVSQHYAIVTLLDTNITFQLLSTFYSFHVSLLLYHITSWRRLLQLIFLGAPPCPWFLHLILLPKLYQVSRWVWSRFCFFGVFSLSCALHPRGWDRWRRVSRLGSVRRLIISTIRLDTPRTKVTHSWTSSPSFLPKNTQL